MFFASFGRKCHNYIIGSLHIGIQVVASGNDSHTSELDELREKYAIEGDFRQKIALKKQIEILEEQKQKMVRAFHDEMSTLEEEAVNMQKQFAEDILVKTQLVTKIVIKF